MRGMFLVHVSRLRYSVCNRYWDCVCTFISRFLGIGKEEASILVWQAVLARLGILGHTYHVLFMLSPDLPAGGISRPLCRLQTRRRFHFQYSVVRLPAKALHLRE